jgi:hypothetical protein
MQTAEALMEIIHEAHDGIHNGFPPSQALRNVALESDVR